MHHATETKHEHTVTKVVEVTNNSKTVNKDRTNPAQPSSLKFHELDLLQKLSAKAKEGKKLSSPDREKLYELTHRSEGEEAAKKVIQAYHQNRLKSKSSAEETHKQNTQDVQEVHLTNRITKPEENKSETPVATPPVSTAKIETDAKEKKDPLTIEDKKSASGGTNHTAVAAGLPAGEGAALAIKGISEGAKLGATAARQASKAVVPGVEKAAERSGSLVGRGIVSAARAAKVSAKAAYRGAKVAAPVIGKGLYLGAKGGATLGAAAVTGTGLAIYHGAKTTAEFFAGAAKGASRALKDGGNQNSNYSSSIVPYAGGPASGGYPSISGSNPTSAIVPFRGRTSQSGSGTSGSQNNPPRSISSGASGLSSSPNDWQKLGLSAAPSSATEVKAAFKKAALSNHSDKGGSGDMDSLRSARDRLLERIEQSQ